ncbi:MAG: inosamine-phosphate amidinotransferase 1 [Bacteroidetes bacterium]|nr:inosamine-phosphate amidinotransferase 1 [Bacteroidota bacterium]
MAVYLGSNNEWDPLEEVIIGDPTNAQIPNIDKGQMAIEFANVKTDKIKCGPFLKQVISETEEDLNELIKVLRKCEVKVRRPQMIEHSKTFKTYDWESSGFYNYAPRDSTLIIGNKIIEAPMSLRSRFLENYAYKDIFIEYFKEGARWISAPKPRLLDSTYNLSNANYLPLTNEEPIFDAANIIRAGKDIFYLISSTGNEMGATWLQSILGDKYRVHKLRNLYEGVHLDSTISLLKPGLVLLNSERVNEDNLPIQLQKWDKIWCHDLVDIGYSGAHAYSSVWIGMNLLMLNPNLAIVDKRQTKLIKLLEKNKIDVIGLQLRHSRSLGGGFHCVSLDTRRKGIFEDYF